MRKILSLLITIVFLCSTSSIAFAVDNPQDAIAQNKIRFQQMNESILETNKQITDLNMQTNILNIEITKNNKDITEINKAVQAEKIHTDQLSNEIKASQDLASKRLRAMYINNYDENFIGLLLTAENFSDFISKYEAAKSIVAYDKNVLTALSEKRKVLNDSINRLNLKNQQLEKLKQTNTESLNKINEDKQRLEALVKQFNEERNSAAQLIKENEEKLIAHAVSAIDSEASTSLNVKSALQTLNSLVPQISTNSVKDKAKEYISLGNKKLTTLLAKEAAEANAKPASSIDIAYKATYTMSATAYTGGGFTAMGLKTVRDPDNLSTIAVDPSVIPLGTKVYIPGYGYAICSDTGGAVKGNIIDLYMNTYEECIRWGRRQVPLYIVAYPGEW